MKELLEKFCDKFGSDFIEVENNYVFVLNFNKDTEITLKYLGNDVYLQSDLIAVPQKEKELFFNYLMKANLLGNGTQNCIIGLNKNEKILTLTYRIPYENNYKLFEENLEIFINSLVYLENELIKLKE